MQISLRNPEKIAEENFRSIKEDRIYEEIQLRIDRRSLGITKVIPVVSSGRN